MLAWLFGEPEGEAVREALSGAQLVLSSELTLVECDRALVRGEVTRRVLEAVAWPCSPSMSDYAHRREVWGSR